jgi:hypothetical protein
MIEARDIVMSKGEKSASEDEALDIMESTYMNSVAQRGVGTSSEQNLAS